MENIVRCGVKNCPHDRKRAHNHKPNPNAGGWKGMEMAVLRTLLLIDAFDALEKGQDWTDVPMPAYRKILGNDHYQQRNVVAEVYRRWKDGRIYAEVLDLHANLPPAAQARKEIKDGVHRINARLAGRGEGGAARPAARRRSRRA
jgi:hypothetical protein